MQILKSAQGRGIILNYASHGLGYILLMWASPVLLQGLGSKGWGAVSVMALAQIIFSLLDSAVSPTMTYILSGERCGKSNVVRLKEAESVRTLGFYFSTGAVVIASLIILGVNFFIEEFDIGIENLILIIIICYLRLNGFISRSILVARRRQQTVAMIEISANLLRYPVAISILSSFEILTVHYFFIAVLLAALIEMTMYVLFGSGELEVKVGPDMPKINALSGFSSMLSLAGGSALMWLFLSQFDRLLFAKILDLSEFGYFTLLITVCSLLLGVPGPVGRSLLPTFRFLISQANRAEAAALYSAAVRFVGLFVMPATLVCVFEPRSILSLWLSDDNAIEWVAAALPCYVISAFIMAVMTFLYHIQVAHGNLKYHFRMNILSIIVYVPVLTIVALNYDVVSVAMTVLFLRLLPFIFWSEFVYKRFLPGYDLVQNLKELFMILIVTSVLLVAVFIVINFLGLSRPYSILGSLILVTLVQVLWGLKVLESKLTKTVNNDI